MNGLYPAPKPLGIHIDAWSMSVGDMVRIMSMFPQDRKVVFTASGIHTDRCQMNTAIEGEPILRIDLR